MLHENPAFLGCLLLTLQILSRCFLDFRLCVCEVLLVRVHLCRALRVPLFSREPNNGSEICCCPLSSIFCIIVRRMPPKYLLCQLAGNGSFRSSLVLCVFLPTVGFGQKHRTSSAASIIPLIAPSFHSWQKTSVLK